MDPSLAVASTQLLINVTKMTCELISNLKSSQVKQTNLESKLQGFIEFFEELQKTKSFIESRFFKHKAEEYAKFVEELDKLVSDFARANILRKSGKMKRIMTMFIELEKIQKDLREVWKDYSPVMTIENPQGRRFWEKSFGKVRAVTFREFTFNFAEEAAQGGTRRGLLYYGGLLRCGNDQMVYLKEFNKFVSVLGAKCVKVYEDDDPTTAQTTLVFSTTSVSLAVQYLEDKGEIEKPLLCKLPPNSVTESSQPREVDGDSEGPTQEQTDAAHWMSECLEIVPYFWDNTHIRDMDKKLTNESEGTYLMRFSTSKPKNLRLLVKKNTGIKGYTFVCKSEFESTSEAPVFYAV